MRNKVEKANNFLKEVIYRDLDYKPCSNKYGTIANVSQDEETISIRTNNLFSTQYGYGMMVGNNKVVWLRSFNVSDHYFYTTVVLTKKYFNVKDYDFQSKSISTVNGDITSNFYFENDENWETMLAAAREQEAYELPEEE